MNTDTYLAALEKELQAILVAPAPAYHTYYGMFQYHLGWVDANLAPVKTDTGKRLRPLLCLLACEATCDDWQRALPVAAAIELVHNFSLIHDDIEDQSDERRGRLAVWKVWGLAHGLNAGDGMYMLARLALDRLWQQGIAPQKCAQINHVFDSTTLAICQGQFLDISFETRLDVTIEEYLQMIRGKTAALIAASLRLGAMLGTDDTHVIEALAQFGENIGLAFQMVDDILGVWGDPAITGKSAATDILSKKKALPAILALNHPQSSATMRTIYSQPHLTADDVAHVLRLLDTIGAREQTQQRADEYRTQALRALDSCGLHHRAITQLREIAEAMTRRVK